MRPIEDFSRTLPLDNSWTTTLPPAQINDAGDALVRANADTAGGSVRGGTLDATLDNLEASRQLVLGQAAPTDNHQINQAYDALKAQFESGQRVDDALGEVQDIVERANGEDDEYQKGQVINELADVLEGLTPEETQAVFDRFGAQETEDLGALLATQWDGGINESVPLGQNDIYESLAAGLSMSRLTSLTIGLTKHDADAATSHLAQVIGEQGGDRAIEYIQWISTWKPSRNAMDAPDEYAFAIAEVMAQLEGPDLNRAVAVLDQTRLDAVMRAAQETYTGSYGMPLSEAILTAAAESDAVTQARVFASAGASLESIMGDEGQYSGQIHSTALAMAELLASNPNAILNELRPTEQNSTEGSAGIDNAGRSLVAMNTVLVGDYTNYRKSERDQQLVGELMSRINQDGAANGVPDEQVAANLGFFTGSAFNALENCNIDARDAGDDALVNIAIGLAGEIPAPGAEVIPAIIDEVRDSIGDAKLENAQESNQALAETFLELALEQVPETADRSDTNTEKFNEYFSFTRNTQLDR
jgi:hypothetical protein